MTAPRLGELHDQIAAAGIPLDGVSLDQSGALSIQFRAEATEAQRTQAQALAAAFDLRPRRPRSIASILTALQALTSQDQVRVRNLVIAHYLRSNPEILQRAGIDISGDEPEG